MSWLRACVVFILIIGGQTPTGLSCPFCSLMGSTITLDIEQAQIAFVGVAQADGRFAITRILKGEDLLQIPPDGLEVSAAKPNTPTLVLGNRLEAGTFDWQDIRAINRAEFDYVVGALAATQSESVDLAFFFPFLGHARQSISDDAYYQFARSSYANIREHQAFYDRDRVVELIVSKDTMPELRLLSFTLLGIVGNEGDAHLALDFIERDDAASSRSLAGVMSSYLALAGEEGLAQLQEKYLKNHDARYELVHSAIEAIRFHLKETDQLDRQQLLNALHSVIENREISDVVIPDLIDAQDWTVIDKVAELFREAPDDKRWIRVAAAKYLMAAPADESQSVIDELREIDESAFIQAKTGKAPIPKETPPASNPASRSFFDWATVFLASPLLATAVIAVVIAMILISLLRLFSKKKA